jgi:hypothetical protein
MENKDHYTPEEVGSMVSMAYNLGISFGKKDLSEAAQSSYENIRRMTLEEIPENVRTSGTCPLEDSVQ